jgi:EAL domain-containing protein (putative c-di-GMP-specific phosphodiesterase class I)
MDLKAVPPELIAAAERVVRNRELKVVYQPLVEFKTGRIFAYEVLCRATADEFRSPPELFDAAVAAQCCGELGRILRELAIEGCPDSPLFLNLHPDEFDDRWLVRPDDPCFLHEHPVYLEITESVPLSHYKLCHSVLAELRSKGMKLAVDDLGSGYSNLKYIADLAPEIVKLDRALITAMHENRRLQRLVRSIVQLCQDQGADVVAEGIETVDEFTAVRDLGVHYAQGYFLARPAFPPPQLAVDPMSL